MTNARASSTSAITESRPIRPIRDPSIPAPVRVERTTKQPGSKVVMLSRWYEVQEDGTLEPC